MIDEVGLEKRERDWIKKKKKTSGSPAGKEKQKGDETQLHGKDVCVFCVCTRLSALLLEEAPEAGQGILPPREPSDTGWSRSTPPSRSGCGLRVAVPPAADALQLSA